MKTAVIRSAAGLVPVLALAAASAACEINMAAQDEQVVQKEERQFTVTGKPSVHLATFDGSVDVQVWEKKEVHVTIEKRAASAESAKQIEVKTSQDGDRVKVEVVEPKGTGISLGHGRSARLIAMVPKSADVEVRTGDGAITVASVSGRVDLRSGDGSIKATGLSGEVVARSGDGAIAVEGATGRVEVSTGDGSVRIEGSPGVVSAHSGDGAIQINAAAGTTMTGPWDVTTGDGSIRVVLPAGFAAELDAHTGDGGITASDFGLEPPAEGPRNQIKGRLGAGGPLLKIRTGDGAVSVGKN